MRSLLRQLLKLFVSSARVSIHFSILARLFVFTLAQIKPSKDPPNNRIPSKPSKPFTLLVLSIGEFRSDIQCIANTGQFRVLYIRGHWQSRMFSAFYPTGHKKYGLNHHPGKLDFQYGKNRNRFRRFLLHFLRKFYRYTQIECVLSPHHRLVCDGDWGAVSKKIGIPFVLLPRDSQFRASKKLFEINKEMFSKIPRFEGTHIIVQSRLDIPVYVDSGYIDSDQQISALGCPRMDHYIREHYTDPFYRNIGDRSTIVYLPFPVKGSKPFEEADVPTLSLFQSAIFQCLLKIAVEHPNLTVVVKSKAKLGFKSSSNDFRSDQFRTEITNLAKEKQIDLAKLENFVITSDLDLLELFPTAKVVCGITTSALLEASAIGIRVVIPYFTELQSGNLKEKLFFSDYYHCFEIAKNSSELFNLLTNEEPNFEDQRTRLTQQRKIFEDFISSTTSRATQEYSNKLTSIITSNGS